MAADDGQGGDFVSLAEAEQDAPQLQLALLDINDVARAWEQIAPLLQTACEFSNGEFTPEVVLAGMGLHDGVERLKMLAIADGERITSIMVVCIGLAPSGKKSLECILTAGQDVKAWMPFEPMMDEWAREQGCVCVRIPRARKGWLKALSHWRIGGYVLEREL